MFITYYRIDQRRDFGFPIAGELFGVFYDKRGWLSIRVRASPIPLQACTTFGLRLVALMKSTILNVFEKQGASTHLDFAQPTDIAFVYSGHWHGRMEIPRRS